MNFFLYNHEVFVAVFFKLFFQLNCSEFFKVVLLTSEFFFIANVAKLCFASLSNVRRNSIIEYGNMVLLYVFVFKLAKKLNRVEYGNTILLQFEMFFF